MKYSKITISGKICTGKSTLLQRLQKKLKWPIILTGQYFREYVKKHELVLEKAEEQNERLTKKVDYHVKDLLNKPGHLIVDGWMSGIMANSLPGVLRILLISDDDVRYKRFAEREKISFAEAKAKVEERQNNWLRRLKKIYHRNDFFAPMNYNFIIDTTNLSESQVLQKVHDKLGFRAKLGPNSLK